VRLQKRPQQKLTLTAAIATSKAKALLISPIPHKKPLPNEDRTHEKQDASTSRKPWSDQKFKTLHRLRESGKTFADVSLQIPSRSRGACSVKYQTLHLDDKACEWSCCSLPFPRKISGRPRERRLWTVCTGRKFERRQPQHSTAEPNEGEVPSSLVIGSPPRNTSDSQERTHAIPLRETRREKGLPTTEIRHAKNVSNAQPMARCLSVKTKT